MSRILIVEDNPDIALLYQRALFQYENVIAPSAEEALQMLEDQTFGLVILDMHLPAQSGLTVLETIRATPHLKTTKVFAISADDLMREACRSIGIDAWMTKPIEVDELIDNTRQLLDSRS